ncbi:MAG: Coenzyme F420 hydrogenase/dehydrogenase, beta subunit C-terminal domain [Oscillospiraceae bacterium]
MDCYAFKNKTYINSSSGGAFPSIVEVLSDELGDLVVYGAALKSDFEVEHIRCNAKDAYKLCRGSKYVQSEFSESLKFMAEDLRNGKNVLFTGTPCQIAAARKMISNKNINSQNLYMVDILCHGSPEKKYWHDYIAWLEKKEHDKLVNYSFRYSVARWRGYPVMAEFKSGKKIINTFNACQYMSLYFTNMIMKPCCYNCQFANINRQGDLTIGDFWGIEKVLPEFPFNKNVSEILVSTSKGEKIIDLLKQSENKDIFIQKCESNEYVSYQDTLNYSIKKPAQYEEFKKDYDDYGFEYVIKKYSRYNLKGFIIHCLKRVKNIILG